MANELDWHTMVAADKGLADNNFGSSSSRASESVPGNQQEKTDTQCWYYGKKGHKESECWKKRANLDNSGSKSGRSEQENRQQSHYAEGSEGPKTRKGSSFVMKHMMNSMKKTTSQSNEV